MCENIISLLKNLCLMRFLRNKSLSSSAPSDFVEIKLIKLLCGLRTDNLHVIVCFVLNWVIDSFSVVDIRILNTNTN